MTKIQNNMKAELRLFTGSNLNKISENTIQHTFFRKISIGIILLRISAQQFVLFNLTFMDIVMIRQFCWKAVYRYHHAMLYLLPVSVIISSVLTSSLTTFIRNVRYIMHFDVICFLYTIKGNM